MRLTIGENIRKLRREKDMTQERLAELLGVTYQSVSRWENGTAYPDMELLPPLAQLFGVSVDALLGMPEEEKLARSKKMISDFCKATFETPNDFEKLKSMLAEIRRDGIIAQMWRIWLESNTSVRNSKEMLPEFRLLAEKILEVEPKDSVTINTMTVIEDDEHIGKFLEKYSYDIDLLHDNLLRRRYRAKGEWDKYEEMKQYRLGELIDLIISESFSDTRKTDLAENTAANKFKLDLLHGFCGETPTAEHPIAPKGEVDFFAQSRLTLGIARACYLGASGDREDALIALEDTVAYLEKIMEITTPRKIDFGSPWIRDITAEAYEDWDTPSNNPTLPLEREIYFYYIHGGVTTCSIVFPSNILYQLTAEHGWEWFDPIRNEPRYKAAVERVRALVKIKEA